MIDARLTRAVLLAVLALTATGMADARAASVTPYATDASTVVLYHLNEETGLHSSNTTHPDTAALTFPVADSSGNAQNLRTNYDLSNLSSSNSNPAISPFDGVASVNGLGTAATIGVNTSGQRLYRSGVTDVDLFNTQTFTIEAWVRSPGTSGFPGIVALTGDTEIVNFSLGSGGSGLQLGFRYTNSAFISYASSAFSYDPDTWYHVAVTYSGDGTGNDSEIRFYVDSEDTFTDDPTRPGTQLGAAITGVRDINAFEAGENGTITVGELTSSNGNFLNGDIDEVRYSNAVRSEFNLAFVIPSPAALPAGLAMLALAATRRRRRHA